jgi:hypothetical protein
LHYMYKNFMMLRSLATGFLISRGLFFVDEKVCRPVSVSFGAAIYVRTALCPTTHLWKKSNKRKPFHVKINQYLLPRKSRRKMWANFEIYKLPKTNNDPEGEKRYLKRCFFS